MLHIYHVQRNTALQHDSWNRKITIQSAACSLNLTFKYQNIFSISIIFEENPWPLAFNLKRLGYWDWSHVKTKSHDKLIGSLYGEVAGQAILPQKG